MKSQYHVTYHAPDGLGYYFGCFDTARKARNFAKKSATKYPRVFFNVTVWEGCPGGIRLDTYNEREDWN